jgi:hypothetical protein
MWKISYDNCKNDYIEKISEKQQKIREKVKQQVNTLIENQQKELENLTSMKNIVIEDYKEKRNDLTNKLMK